MHSIVPNENAQVKRFSPGLKFVGAFPASDSAEKRSILNVSERSEHIQKLYERKKGRLQHTPPPKAQSLEPIFEKGIEMQNGKASIKLRSMITCPKCGHQKEETMPTDACEYFQECTRCHAVLRPKAAIAASSYGSVAYPPVQKKQAYLRHIRQRKMITRAHTAQ